MQKILVTGASGFIGSEVAKYLTKNYYHVICVTRNKNKQQQHVNNGIIEWVEINLFDDTEKLQTILNDTDYIIHIAGLTPKNNNIHIDTYLKYNVEITKNLALSAANTPTIKRFIYISTIKVHGENSGKDKTSAISETSGINPKNDYSLSKYEAEKILKNISKENKLDHVIFRPPMVYGKGVGGNFLSLIRYVDRCIPMPFSLIKNTRSILYVENFANAITLSLKHPEAVNQTFVIRDIDVSVPDLINEIAFAMKRKVTIFPVPVSLLKLAGIIFSKKATISKLTDSLQINDKKVRSTIGWKPPINFNDSIRATVQWYMEEY